MPDNAAAQSKTVFDWFALFVPMLLPVATFFLGQWFQGRNMEKMNRFTLRRDLESDRRDKQVQFIQSAYQLVVGVSDLISIAVREHLTFQQDPNHPFPQSVVEEIGQKIVATKTHLLMMGMDSSCAKIGNIGLTLTSFLRRPSEIEDSVAAARSCAVLRDEVARDLRVHLESLWDASVIDQ